MSDKKPLDRFMRVFPIIILLFGSLYFAYTSWEKYDKNKIFQDSLVTAMKLETVEYAVLNELLCTATLTSTSKNLIKICEKTKATTDGIVKNDIADKHASEEVSQKINFMRTNFTSKSMDNLATVLDNKKSILFLASQYVSKLEMLTNIPEEKELLRLYAKVSDISSMTEVEKVLVTYYLSKDIPISTQNFIYWDKIVASSYYPKLENEVYVPSVKSSLLKISHDKVFIESLQKIDDMRIDILTKGATARYTKNSAEWITVLRKKQKALQKVETLLLSEVHTSAGKRLENTFWYLIGFASLFLLSLISLIFISKKTPKVEKDNKALLKVVKNIHNLSSYSDNEVKAMNLILDEAKTDEDLFAYIDTSFHLLQEKGKQIQDEANVKNQFLSTMSHEIRTPLNGIIGFSKLLKNMDVQEEQEEYLSLIEKSSNNLLSIVNDVLDISKIDADKMELDNVPFDIFEVVETTVAAFAQQADQKDIELGLFVDPFLAHNFMGDSTKLMQILTNLIGNAIKFTDAYGKISIFVQNIHHTEDQSEIKFAVQDDGIGLSDEQQKNIFNAYAQGTTTTSSKYGGTGLGLTISTKIVELMGGKLAVESKEHHGANFHFTLILQKDKENKPKAYPDFSDLSVGLALPIKSIKRQLDTNLEVYVRHLGAEFKTYYYEDLFEDYKYIELPDIMIFDHHYARLPGELEQCASIDCKSVLLTTGSLQSRISPIRHHFSDIILTPVSLAKTIRILRTAKKEEEVIDSRPKKLEFVNSFDGLRALVSDDYAINRKLIKIILEKMGLEVTIVEDGAEALKMRKENEYDIIFMDIQMPVMDGLESTRLILEYEDENDLRHIPIIALSANALGEDSNSYKKKGMDGFVTKPVEVDVLKSTIEEYCGVELTSKDKEKSSDNSYAIK